MGDGKMSVLLRMLMTLSTKRRYSLHELMERFDVSESTAYRHIRTIEGAGFVVAKLKGSYRLALESSTGKTLKNLLHFTPEEVYILERTMDLLHDSVPVKSRLLLKLHTLYDTQSLAKLANTDKQQIVQQLAKAIENKCCLNLKDYRSNNSQKIEDRLVEAFEFLPDYSGIWCYETASDSCKQFKISRIAAIEVLAQPWANEAAHTVAFTDAFRMSGSNAKLIVEARLSLKAFNLLIEEFPLAEQYLIKHGDYYRLKVPVASFEGIGRFVLGMAGEVHIVSPKSFINFLEKKQEKKFTVAG